MRDVFPIRIYRLEFMQRSEVYPICVSKRRRKLRGSRTALPDGFPSTSLKKSGIFKHKAAARCIVEHTFLFKQQLRIKASDNPPVYLFTVYKAAFRKIHLPKGIMPCAAVNPCLRVRILPGISVCPEWWHISPHMPCMYYNPEAFHPA